MTFLGPEFGCDVKVSVAAGPALTTMLPVVAVFAGVPAVAVKV